MSDERGYISFLARPVGRPNGDGLPGHARVDRIYRFAFRTTLDHNAAEDVVQETLLAMICGLDTLRDDRRFWPWIYRIAWSKIQNGHRDRRLQSSLEAEMLVARTATGNGFTCDDTPLDVQVREEMTEHVAAAIHRLSQDHRDVLELRCYDQLDYAEIAARTRTTPARARTTSPSQKVLKTRLACCV